MKCYHKKYRSATRDVIFRLQFHTGAVQGYGLLFAKEELDNACKGTVTMGAQGMAQLPLPLRGTMALSILSRPPIPHPQIQLSAKLLPI